MLSMLNNTILGIGGGLLFGVLFTALIYLALENRRLRAELVDEQNDVNLFREMLRRLNALPPEMEQKEILVKPKRRKLIFRKASN